MVEQTLTQQAAQSAEASKAHNKISFEEFLRLYDGQHAEWLDGEVIVIMPASLLHQKLLAFLYIMLSTYLDARSLGTLIFAPFAMKIAGKSHGREPDLMFVNTAHADRLKPNHVEGAADLVIEIVSPESMERDRGEKFTEYETAGVAEYGLIDPLHKEALFYHLEQIDGESHYRPLIADANGDLNLIEIAGFRMHVQTLWQTPLPTVQEAVEIVQAMIGH